MSGEWVSAHNVRREVPTVVYDVLKELESKGLRIRRQGHKFKLYCPCKKGWVTVNGSPQNAGVHAKRVRQQAEHCPNRHDLDA